MSNSTLCKYIHIVGNYSDRQSNGVSRIIIHHMAGNLSLETLGKVMESRQSSATYGIDVNGNIGRYVDEAYRPWTSSSWEADKCAVTIEVANNSGAPDWTVSDASMNALIELCADICKRNGIAKLNYTGDKSGNLHMHKWYASTACPGPYLESKFGHIAEEVNKRLNGSATTAPSNPATPSNDLSNYTDAQLADKVIAGKFGNGDARKVALGSRYNAVQTIVNQKLNGPYSTPTPTKKSVEEVAKEVIAGKWGNGTDRMKALESAGYNYSEVQNKVNQILAGAPYTRAKTVDQLADEVYKGLWGNGEERKQRLTNAGYDYNAVQARVNSKYYA